MHKSIYGQKVIRVYCKNCKDWMDEASVEFLNIEEGMMGEDRLTFKCPKCHSKQISVRVG